MTAAVWCLIGLVFWRFRVECRRATRELEAARVPVPFFREV
jgi:hypothetical protein